MSKLITTLILALFISLSLQSQSGSTHVISIHDDEQSLEIEFQEGDVALLKIDGVTIDKEDYPSYQHILDKYKKRTKANYYDTNSDHGKKDMKVILIEKLKKYLSKNQRFDESDFEFKLTDNHMVVNGRKLNRNEFRDCSEIFDETAGYSLSRGSYFHVDISPGSRSVSLSINE